MHHYVTLYLHQNSQKEIHPGATPFSRVKGFRMFSIKPWYLCNLSQQRGYRNCNKNLEETILDGVMNESANVDFFLFFSGDHLTGDKLFIAIL